MTRPAPRLDRRALFATGAAAALLAATGVSAQAAPRRGGRLRMALSGASRADCFGARAPQGLFMQVATAGLVFDTLTEIAADGTLRGELSTAWHASPDARRWAFDLRRDVRFHDGRRLTARDVVASLRRHAHRLHNVADMAATGDHALRVDLHSADPHLPFALSRADLVIHPADASDGDIGTGLYRVTHFRAGQQLLAQRVAQHWKDGQAGWFDTVELVSVPSAAVRAEALRDLYVDAADLLDPSAFITSPDITLLPGAQTMTHAAHRTVALPAQIGTELPLDNLRAAERWWRA